MRTSEHVARGLNLQMTTQTKQKGSLYAILETLRESLHHRRTLSTGVHVKDILVIHAHCAVFHVLPPNEVWVLL